MNYTAYLKKELNSFKKETISDEEVQESLDMVVSEINKRLAEKRKSNLSECLSFDIGIHLDKNAKNKILNGDKSAWVLIEKQTYWEGYIIPHSPDSYYIDSRTFGGTIGMAMLWGYDEIAATISAFAEKWFLKDKERYQKEQAIHVFMASLFYKYRDGKMPEFFQLIPPDHIYQRLMAAWQDESMIGDLLSEACDYHLLSTMDNADKSLEILSFDLIPFDIRAIELVRKKEGLSTPTIDHPLLKTPLADIPAERPGYDPATDEVFQLVARNEK